MKRGKRILSIILSVIMLTTFLTITNVFASDIVAKGTCGNNANWTLDSEGTFRINGTGRMNQYTFSNGAPWKEYKNQIFSVFIEDGITSIGSYAFYGYNNLTTVKMPNSISEIYDGAFGKCYKLEDAVIPNGVNTIHQNAFEFCSGLKEILIPNTVKTIDEYAFYECENVEKIILNDNTLSIGKHAFDRSKITFVEVPKGIDNISEALFYWCTELSKVVIYKNIKSIEEYAFSFCLLKDIYFEGSEIEWKAIKKSGVTESVLKDVTIHCNHQHEYTEENIINATCTQTGLSEFVCECGKTYTNEILATGHQNTTTTNAKEATCTKEGYTGDTYCSDCETVISNGKILSATGHTYGEWKTIKAATHLEEGSKEKVCSSCGDVVTENIDKITEHSYSTVVTNPTCTEQGYTTYTCECGDSYVDDYTDIIPHTYGEWKTIKAATHLEEGSKEKVCSSCGDVVTEKIVKIAEHSYSTVITNPTCTEQGYTTYTCECGDSYISNYVNCVPHSYGDWKIEKKAICSQTGLKTKICSECNNKVSETIAKTSHKYGDWVILEEANCEKEGLKTKTCSECGDVVKEKIPTANHKDNDNDGFCDDCKKEVNIKNCSHICHAGGFVGFIWKIVNFFLKTFRVEKFHYCKCGRNHWK